MIKIDSINIKRLSELVKMDLPEDVTKYISDVSTLLSVIPSRLESLDLEHPEEMISSTNATETNEIAFEDLGTQEGRYFVSKRSVS